MDYFVIRQSSDEREKLFNEIKEGRLRQGWSFNPQLSLCQSEDEFVLNYTRDDDQPEEARKRYVILQPMRSIKPGDILVVPKQPDYDHFLILIAARNPNKEDHSYDFIDPLPGTDDYRNVVYVNSQQIKQFHFDGKSVPPVMKQRLRSIAYSSAMNAVANRVFIDGIQRCLQLDESSNQRAEPLKARLADIREKTYRTWIQSVRSLTPSDFEKLVRIFMESGGYRIVRLNHYDRQGKDVDVECERIFDLNDPLGTSHTVRYRIQIKKHDGKTDERAVRQLLDDDSGGFKDGGRKISIVISTADDFTDECKRLAESHGIVLMNGIEFARVYFRSINKDD